MKITLIFLFLNLIGPCLGFARAPAVLPGVEIVPEIELQKDHTNAKGHSFSQFRQKDIRPTTMEEQNSNSSTFDGFIFFLAILLPGVLAWIIMSKAHSIPTASNEDSVLYLKDDHDDFEDSDNTKAS